MAKSVGFKVNKNLFQFFQDQGWENNNAIAQHIGTIRAITGKYMRPEEIAGDIQELLHPTEEQSNKVPTNKMMQQNKQSQTTEEAEEAA